MWNLSKPTDEIFKTIEQIKFRGYDKETFLTGEFARRIAAKIELDKDKKAGTINQTRYEEELKANGGINALSVSAIADKYCHTRRDLYIEKGSQRPKIEDYKTWGRIAGPLVERYLFGMMAEQSDSENYGSVVEKSLALRKSFAQKEKKSIALLENTEGKDGDTKIGDTDWFMQLLDYNGRAELAIKILNSRLKQEESMDVEDIELWSKIKPNVAEIGISSPATPDFISPKAHVVGDIKTGVNFAAHHQLTCAGYALAYENQHEKEKAEINWGIVYFFPTRNPSAYVKPISFAQVLIFPIDDILRGWFLSTRNEAYRITSKSTIPPLPEKTNRTHCRSCKNVNYCKEDGLELE
jgi:CRISPR/Cas system-associated exonuclease Cas4 (RecB family)